MSKELTLQDVFTRVQTILRRGYHGSHFDFGDPIELSEKKAHELAEKAWSHYRNAIPLEMFLSNVRTNSKRDEMIENFKQSYLSCTCFWIDSMYVFYQRGKHEYGYSTRIEVFASKNHFKSWLNFMLSKELENTVSSSVKNRTKFFISKGSDRDMDVTDGNGRVSVGGVSSHDGRDGSGFSFNGSASLLDVKLDKLCIYFKATNYLQLL